MRQFRTLKVWQKSHTLTLLVYHSTKLFPREERFGLTSKLRRSAASIPSNIAEGCGRKSDKEFLRFLEIALSSGYETEYQVLLAYELEYIDESRYQRIAAQTVEVNKMLNRFITKLSYKIKNPNR